MQTQHSPFAQKFIKYHHHVLIVEDLCPKISFGHSDILWIIVWFIAERKQIEALCLRQLIMRLVLSLAIAPKFFLMFSVGYLLLHNFKRPIDFKWIFLGDTALDGWDTGVCLILWQLKESTLIYRKAARGRLAWA